MSDVTSPIITDATGQAILNKLNEIKQVLSTPSDAEDINYDNTTSGMTADNVQSAVDELKSNLTRYKRAVFTGTWSNIAVNSPTNKYIDISSLNLQDFNQILSITILTTQPAWLQTGLGVSVNSPSTTSLTIGIINRYNTALTCDYMLIIFYKDN